jgi:hypothetical protein
MSRPATLCSISAKPQLGQRSSATVTEWSHLGQLTQPSTTRSVTPVRDHRAAMLFPKRILLAIRDGSVDLAFRRWERARVLPGTRMRTAVGVLEIRRVEVIEPAGIADDDARRAGFDSRDDLLSMLDRRDSGDIYRIELRYAGADPRVELRGRADLTDDELADVASRLERLDEASRHGPWTRAVLRLIAERPEVRAEELAASMGREKLPFKRDVRKLKELGLTESLSPGYRLSPRGQAVLKRLRP